jgi:V/A-type H+/Na+-transporting ATPase subunit K
MRTRTLWTYVDLTAVFGLIVAIYAGLETLDTSLRSSCTISSFFSCSAVDSSGHTTTLGIPDAAIGIAGFIVILIVAGLAERRTADLRSLYALLFVTTAGVAVASYFAGCCVVRDRADDRPGLGLGPRSSNLHGSRGALVAAPSSSAETDRFSRPARVIYPTILGRPERSMVTTPYDSLAAGIAIAGGLIGTGMAQSGIGAAGMGIIAEKPEKFGQVLFFFVIPETLWIIGFVLGIILLLGIL